MPRATLTRALLAIPTARSAYLAELQSQLDNVFDEAELIAEIDRIEALIARAMGDISVDLDAIRDWINAHRDSSKTRSTLRRSASRANPSTSASSCNQLALRIEKIASLATDREPELDL